MAVRTADAVKAGWSPVAADFNLIGLVTVRVVHQGQPVEAAHVTLKDKSRTQSQVLDSNANGTALFYGVTPGEQTVTVEYRSGSKAAEPVTQLFKLALSRENPEPVLEIAISGDVATLGSGPGSPAGGSQSTNNGTNAGSKKPAETAPPFVRFIGSMVTYLIGLLVAIGLVYFIMRYLKDNPKTIQTQLDKLGVKVPDPPSDDPNVYAASTNAPKAPQPVQKIVLDDAAPTPLGANTAVYTPGAAVVSEPKLVRDNGEFAFLSEGTTVVGREDGLGISLAGESSISRRHAELIRQGSVVTLRDLGSTNGSYVNGQAVQGDQQLRPGDQVQFGAIRFRYEG
jgi:hypothetical protein